MILALGVVAIAGIGGFAASQGRSSPSTKTPPSWGLYSPQHWGAVTSSFARRGFARNSIRVVTGTKGPNGQPFALIEGRSNSGRTCFAVIRGSAIGVTICRFSKPVTVFSVRDKCAPCAPDGPPIDTRTILALIRPGVTVTISQEGRESGVGMVPAGTGFALNLSGVRSGARLRARDASGHVLANIALYRG
jgi:hypothetical protein